MSAETVSVADPHPRKRASALGVEIAYAEAGAGDPIVLLHGNPTSSYLWRNVIPHLAGLGRCLAPDLIGMGRSGKEPQGRYRFADHARHLDAWFDALGLARNVVLLGHDWGGALGFDWARRNPGRVQGIAYTETIVAPLAWDDWPENARGIFQALRSPAGEALILEKNVFVERILPSAILRKLGPEEMDAYRRPFAGAEADRRPTLAWPREIPIAGEPKDMVETVAAYGRFLAASPLPKLFLNAEPGSILLGRQREICRRWPNQVETTVAGAHFVPEDSPHAIGRAVAAFLARLRKPRGAAS